MARGERRGKNPYSKNLKTLEKKFYEKFVAEA